MKIGDKFNRLTLVKIIETRPEKDGKKRTWGVFKCDCGNEKEIRIISVKRENTKSCGCYATECKIKNNTTHNLSNTQLHSIWAGMRSRCTNKNMSNYKYYGERGIEVCEDWSNDFLSFYNWAMDNGYKEGLQIDRIDNDGNYEPLNCQWITTLDNCEAGKRRRRYDNKYGFVGISFCKRENKWSSRISAFRKNIWLGYFDTMEQAIEARTEKEIELFGEQRTNFHYVKKDLIDM